MGAKLQGRVKSTHGSRGSHRPMAEINVTPFVDVMLVLLIIFMVAAPLMTSGVAVDLPDDSAGALTHQDSAPVEISIENTGTVYIGDTQVTLDRLQELVAAIAAKDVDRRVYIRADQGLAYGTVMSVMATVNQAGFTKVALITDSE